MFSKGAFGLRHFATAISGDKPMSLGEGKDKEIFNLGIGEPRLSDFPYEIFEDLKHVDKINDYYPSQGDLALRRSILNKYYNNVSVDEIAITHGAIGALDIIFRSNLDVDSEILIPDPGFPPYEKLAHFTRARTLRYEINIRGNDTLINWKSVYQQITEKTKIMLINSPHNPSGKILTKNDLLSLKFLLKLYPDLCFIMDEVYRDLIYTNEAHLDFSNMLNRGYIVNSFSKIFPMQGARIGWVVSGQMNMEKLYPYFNNAYGAISSFGQELAKSLLFKNTDYFSRYNLAKNHACAILDQYGVDYILPKGTFFICINYGLPDLEVVRELEVLGVIAMAGTLFGPLIAGYIRVSFAQPEDVIDKSFTILGEHWIKKQREIIEC